MAEVLACSVGQPLLRTEREDLRTHVACFPNRWLACFEGNWRWK